LAAKTVHAASASTSSFDQASENLSVLAEADVAAKRVGRWVTRIGSERIEQVEQQARAFESLPLPMRQQSPVDVTPELVCIQCDGGRLQIRPRNPPADDSKDSPTFWRESKVGTLIKMAGEVYEQDPCPKIPNLFIDSQRISRLTREIKGFAGDSVEPADPDSEPGAHSIDRCIEPDELHASTRPKPLVRSVIATTKNIDQFGRLMVGEAYQRGFLATSRKAFVCDGMACNWTLQEKHFPRFTPILDFVHAICYVYHAAIGGQLSEASWSRYCVWAQLLWSGEIDKLLEQMECLQNEIGKSTEEDGDTSPRQRLADAIRYVGNQRTRMKYPEYRQAGLPITSAYIESTIPSDQSSRQRHGEILVCQRRSYAAIESRCDLGNGIHGQVLGTTAQNAQRIYPLQYGRMTIRDLHPLRMYLDEVDASIYYSNHTSICLAPSVSSKTFVGA